MKQRNSLSLAEARRIALAAQGFVNPSRAGAANWTPIARTIGRMNLLQLDSVNVLCRSHYLPLYSRLGLYDRSTLDSRAFGTRKRALFECWAHEASLLPLELHPLMRWRMDRARNGHGVYGSMNRFAAEEGAYVKSVLDFVTANGPVTAGDLPDSGKGDGGWWGWSKGKMALEHLFDAGLVTAASRQGFERLYDIPERVIPAATLNLPDLSEVEAIRQLVELSSRALGVAARADLRDYFRLPLMEAKRATDELVEAGKLLPIAVEGWKQPAYLHSEARLPRRAGGTALISPFDPLVWNRDRAERLFGFRYRIEIYTPAGKRRYGYYVLPFLMGERFAARVCLKSDRRASVLRVNAAHVESRADAGETALALSAELHLMARWLGLEQVAVGARGNLTRALRAAL